MNQYRWVNPHQPQTLYMATIICYIYAALGLLFGGIFSLLGLFLVVGLGAGAFGIANEKKWGYGLALAAAVVRVVLFAALGGLHALNNLDFLITFIFAVALVALLLHPQSRDYQRIWFR